MLETLARDGVRFIVAHVGVIGSAILSYLEDMIVCCIMREGDPESEQITSSNSSQNPVILGRDALSVVVTVRKATSG